MNFASNCSPVWWVPHHYVWNADKKGRGWHKLCLLHTTTSKLWNKVGKAEKTSWLTYFVLCKEFYGVVSPRLQMAQVEVWSGEGDHPGGVTRALDHHRHVLILVLNRQQASISQSRLCLDVHLGEPHGGALAGAGHPAHDVETVPGLVQHLAAAQNARPDCEQNYTAISYRK